MEVERAAVLAGLDGGTGDDLSPGLQTNRMKPMEGSQVSNVGGMRAWSEPLLASSGDRLTGVGVPSTVFASFWLLLSKEEVYTWLKVTGEWLLFRR